jgi:hypothetical protein
MKRSSITGFTAAYIKKALAESLTAFLLKRLGCSSTYHCLYPGVPGCQRRQDNPPPALFAQYRPSRLFSLLKSEVRVGWSLAVPLQLKMSWEGVLWTIIKDVFTPPFGGGMNAATCAFRSAATTLRKVDK